tara:strand:- start:54 stop:569 length:516 start_codon:yes stop_codon:yes gene_type:complete
MIKSKRLYLRKFNFNNINKKYISWLQDKKINKFLSRNIKTDKNNLKKYFKKIKKNKKILFLAIYYKKNFNYIGNIKFEPINLKSKFTIMGILIGERKYLGKGLAKEAIIAASIWLYKKKKIKFIFLGVNKKNYRAIKAFKKTGFFNKKSELVKRTKKNQIIMMLRTDKLKN